MELMDGMQSIERKGLSRRWHDKAIAGSTIQQVQRDALHEGLW